MADANTFPFTTERLRQLQPKAQRFEVRDATAPGLVCRVTPAGVKTLTYYRWVPAPGGGKPERVTIGKWPEVSIDTARKRCAAISADVALGKSPTAERRKLRAETTLAELWTKYETEHLPKKAEKTRQDTTALWNLHVPATLKSRHLSEVTHDELAKLHARIGAKHQRTANKVAGLVRAMYRKAAVWQYSGPNPATGIEMFPTEARARYLLPHELPKFLAEAKASPEPFNRLWLLLLLTGVRLNNMLSAPWSEFDLDAGRWEIPSSAHKNRKPHALPLLPDAVTLLREQRERVPKSCPWVWPAPSDARKHIGKSSIRAAWTDLCTRAEVPGLWRHDLRRTVGSYLTADGASLTMVGKALGHRSLEASKVYSHLALGPVRAAMASALAGIAQPAPAKPAEPAA